MPDPIEPTPEVSQAGNPVRADATLTTASLAKAARDETRAPGEKRTFAGADAGSEAGERPGPLFAEEETSQFRSDWDGIQASFVDEPRAAVEAADRLVANAIARLAEIFADEKERLEGQWGRGGDVSTEDLRQALRRYRAFFGRVLSV